MNNLDLVANLTGTMTDAVFLSVLEPNLAILCVSLPMLGPIYHRYIRRGPVTSASKLSGNTSSGAVKTFGSSGPRKHYRLNDDHTYTVTAGVNKGPDVSVSPNGSDVELTPTTPQAFHGIQVERQWVVQNDYRV